MYVDYYGFGIEPFRLSPDHKFCLNHSSFKRAQAYMQYALLRQEGFVVVTGPPGTGKTTLIGELLTDFQASDFAVARLVSARLQGDDLLRMVCYAFNIPADGIRKAEMLQRLAGFVARCHQANRRPLLIVDEAQGLSTGALEELRLLTNQQVDGRQLLQVFLVGQDELRDLLADPGLEQLRQRIVGTCHIEPLQPEQTIDYVRHRLKVAGWQGNPRFEKEVFPPMYRFSRGVPRLINHVCSRLLLHGSLEQKQVLGAEDIALVIAELRAEHLSPEQASSLIDLADHDCSDFPSLEPEPSQAVAAADPDSQPIGERIAQRRLAAAAPVHKRSANVPEQQQAADSESVGDSPAPAAGPIEPLVLAVPLAPIDSEVRLQPESTAPGIEPEPEAVPPSGGRDIRPGVAAPVWGLAASLLLTLLISVIVLVSIPHYQLGRIASEDIWRELGVSRVRTLLSEWSGGIWPLSAPDSVKQRAPARSRVEDIARISRRAPDSPLMPVTQAPATPEVPVEAMHPAYPIDEPAVDSAEPMAADPGNEDNGGLRLVVPQPVVVEPVTASPSAELAVQAKPGVYPRPIAPLTGDEPLQETIVGQVAFAFDSDEISPQYWQLLDELAAELTASPANRAQIIGFTDRSGHSAYNIDLSRRRAAAVADYLLAKGGQEEQLRIEGRGSRALPETNREAAGLRTVRIYLSATRAADVQLLSYGGD